MRADRGQGVSIIALLWPTNGDWPPEIDFVEDGGIYLFVHCDVFCDGVGKYVCIGVCVLCGMRDI